MKQGEHIDAVDIENYFKLLEEYIKNITKVDNTVVFQNP